MINIINERLDTEFSFTVSKFEITKITAMENGRVLDITLEQKVIINNIEGIVNYIGEEVVVLIDIHGKELCIKIDEIVNIILKEKPLNKLMQIKKII